MPIYQYSMYFADFLENTGWSEQVTENNTGGSPAFVYNLQTAQRWAKARAKCGSTDMSILGVVRHTIGVRGSLPFWFDVPIKGKATNWEEPNEASKISIDYRLTTGTGKSRVYWVRSIPYTWVNSGKLTDGGQQGIDLIDGYMNFLTSFASLGLRTTDQAKVKANSISSLPPVGNLVQPIQVSVTTWPNVGPVVPKQGDLVRVTGLRGMPYVNGEWKVSQPNGAPGQLVTFQLENSAKYQIGGPNSGSVQIINPFVAGFTSFGFDRVGSHKTGKIFNQQRGRGSAKVLHSR